MGEEDPVGGAVVAVAVEEDVLERVGQGLPEYADTGGRPRQSRVNVASEIAQGVVWGAEVVLLGQAGVLVGEGV
ncbi:hypothetical protein [Streptomyces yangpuensis]|uniref:hypothetical protein n=1 Tax=Streptomyces yangpuensis TaxID=1648182 RepID=UPI003723F6AC